MLYVKSWIIDRVEVKSLQLQNLICYFKPETRNLKPENFS